MINIGAAAAGAALGSLADVGEKVVHYHNVTNNARSLTSVSSAARVEPPVFIGSDIVHLPWMSDVLQTTQSLFASIWMIAADLITSEVNGVSVLKTLDPLNPNRDPDYSVFLKSLGQRAKRALESDNPKRYFSKEAHQWALPTRAAMESMALARESAVATGAPEAGASTDPVLVINPTGPAATPATPGGRAAATPANPGALTGVSIDSRTNSAINDASNLVSGKMLAVKFGQGTDARTFNIALRMMIAEIPTDVMLELVGDKSTNASFKERLFDLSAGKIGWLDLIFCADLFRERKRLLAKDKTDIIRQVRQRQLQHKKAGLMSGSASMAEMSNIYVISTETAEELKLQFGLDLDSFNQRQKVFENTCGMLLVVVDRNYERVTFYTDTIARSTTVGVVDLKSSNKSKDANIMDIFNAYKEGAAPRL